MIDKVLSYAEGGEYLLASIALVFAILLNLEKILYIINIHKKKRMIFLNEAMADESLSDNLKAHFKDEIQSEYFYQVHKMKVDKFKRELLLETHNKLKGEITLKQFQRANNQLIIKDEKLVVDISKFEGFSFYYNMVMGILMAIFGFALLSVPVNLNDPTIYKILSWFLVCVFFISFGFFMVYQTFPVIIAKRIRKALEVCN